MRTFQPLSHNEREAARVAIHVMRLVTESTREPPDPAVLIDLHVKALNALSLAVASGLAPAPPKIDWPECCGDPTPVQLDRLLETAWTCAHRLRAAAELAYLRVRGSAPHLVAELGEALDQNAKEGL